MKKDRRKTLLLKEKLGTPFWQYEVGVLVLIFIVLLCYFMQFFWAHRHYPRNGEETKCVPLFGYFTMGDRLTDTTNNITKAQPGDILVTLSTHSFGWRHGHVGLVIDEDTTLECVVLGEKSRLCKMKHWGKYTNFALLRIKGITKEEQEAVVAFALEYLQGVEYSLVAGLFGAEEPLEEEPQFGMHCSYLVWYAWKYMGYDIDSDGGRLVTAHDILHSDLLEVVEMYGFDENLEPMQ